MVSSCPSTSIPHSRAAAGPATTAVSAVSPTAAARAVALSQGGRSANARASMAISLVSFRRVPSATLARTSWSLSVRRRSWMRQKWSGQFFMAPTLNRLATMVQLHGYEWGRSLWITGVVHRWTAPRVAAPDDIGSGSARRDHPVSAHLDSGSVLLPTG